MAAHNSFGNTIKPLTPMGESLPAAPTPQTTDPLRTSLPARLTNTIEDIMNGLDPHVFNSEEREAIFNALRKYHNKTVSKILKEDLIQTSVRTLINTSYDEQVNETPSVRTLTSISYKNELHKSSSISNKQKSFESLTNEQKLQSMTRQQRSFSLTDKQRYLDLSINKQASFNTQDHKQFVLMDLVDTICKPNIIDSEYRCGRDYISPHKLGEGAFGVVRYCVDNTTSKSFAKKLISLNKYEKTELDIHRKLSKDIPWRTSDDSGEICCAVVLILGAIQQNDFVYIYMDLMEDGSLADMLRNAEGSLNLGYIVWYFRQILEGLAYIHTRRIIHLDIKADNILVKNGDSLKIADFGLAKQIPDEFEAVYEGFHGTPNFMAPEVIRSELISTKSDIWAAGCVLYELITSNVPWKGIEIHKIYLTVGKEKKDVIFNHTRPTLAKLEELANDFHEEYEFNCDALQKLLNIFQRCFDFNFKSRASANELLDSEDLGIMFRLIGLYPEDSEAEISNLDEEVVETEETFTNLNIRDPREDFASIREYTNSYIPMHT
ncbi:Protein kinase [Oopsacas minuta]|uniref:Protein kinase n=1 Tax=Oopsacas minuta TaxID=111878 RepID=A0AAV7JJX6_9METZ|nr:Protein kinase [Oopsacas minuta]